ncbi:MAG: cytochrome d ubiquinol oxidase subunit II, partial [Bacteroidaceae bacterium]|nr:cytochrome d ubiquinol oxidase subunit II [Bacteroidaceae bacterium]
INGIVGPLLLGIAVSTFFHGAEFTVDRNVMGTGGVISSWASSWHGLEAVMNPWNVVFGLAVMFLSQTLGLLYVMNSIDDETLRTRASVRLWGVAVPFVVLFVVWFVHLIFANGWAVAADGTVTVEPLKYLTNFLDMPVVAVLFLVGVVLVIVGVVINLLTYLVSGIWFAGVGTIVTVLCLLLVAGLNGTAYYPSLVDAQSSLTISNSCSSEFTLTVMGFVSLIVPFVLAYIVWAWRALSREKIVA